MAVTAGGTPYVESSDLVANYPGASLSLANRVDQVMQAPTQNAITSTTYTAALLDAGKTVTLSNAAAVTLTIPAQATVAWVANTQLNFLNLGVGTVTITPAATVTINGTPLTLATSKGGSLVRTASNTWTFIPLSAGVDNANFTNASTGDYTTGGISYKFITFTGSGSLVVDRAGFADVLVIAAGAGGGTNQGGGGGAGGYLSVTNYLVAVGTLTCTVGAGGATATQGNLSAIGPFFAFGGGAGSSLFGSAGGFGGSGGGGSMDKSGGAGVSGQGNSGRAGGSGYSANTGGGGGAHAAATTQAGGAGITSSITNTPVGRAGGGGGGNSQNQNNSGTASAGGGAGGYNAVGTVGTVNTGGGGGGGGNDGGPGSAGAAGGSGVIIVRVVV